MTYIHEHYVELSDGSSDEEDYTDETAMMQMVLADAEHAEEHVLNFEGSIKGHRVLNRNRACDHLTLMGDYFAPLFTHNFHQRFRIRKKCLRPSLPWRPVL